MTEAPVRPPAGSPLVVTLREAYRQQGTLWSDDLLELQVAGQDAGYMVLSHVPSAVLSSRMPRGIVDYARTIKGHSNLRVPDGELPDALRRHLGLPGDAGKGKVALALQRRHGQDWDMFRAFHVDKPFVAYVRLYSEGDMYKGDCGSRPGPREEPFVSYRGLGLAPVLYQQAACWLSRRGFRLHADDNQTDDARKAWEGLARMFPDALMSDGYRPGRSRHVLDGGMTGPSFVPSWAGSLDVMEGLPMEAGTHDIGAVPAP